MFQTETIANMYLYIYYHSFTVSKNLNYIFRQYAHTGEKNTCKFTAHCQQYAKRNTNYQNVEMKHCYIFLVVYFMSYNMNRYKFLYLLKNNTRDQNTASVVTHSGVGLPARLWVRVGRIPPITTVPQGGAPRVVAGPRGLCTVDGIPFVADVHKRKFPFAVLLHGCRLLCSLLLLGCCRRGLAPMKLLQ